ncbi:transporter, major facilitator subfamily protein [Pelomyxa schiedti]|nr:transporter, major facilitator subfamily protein [Pelomyxa schiedti]
MSIVSRAKFLMWLFCLCFSLAGVQFVYSIQFALGTPLFNEQLKVSPGDVAIILSTAGPISGFVVQPIVGVLSDRCTSKWGRRKPFIFIGTLCCGVGMALIGASVDLGNLCGDDPNGPSTSDHVWGLVFAITGLWVMNVFVNAVQGPARAIVSDIVDADRQQEGNAMVSGVMGVAAIIASVAGAQFFMTPDPYRNLFFIGVLFLYFSCVPTLLAGKEEQHTLTEKEKAEGSNILVVFLKIYQGFRYMPRKMIIVVVVFFLSWAAYSPYMIYITTFFGVNIYGGNQDDKKDLYDQGVQMGMYGLAVFAASQWIYSFILPYTIKFTNVTIAYAGSQLLATGCYIVFFWLTKIGPTYGVMALIAINFTTLNSIPFGLVKGLTAGSDAGLYMGVLNAAAVVAQTVTESIAGAIVGACPYIDGSQNVVWGIIFGGAFSAIATVAACFLRAAPTVTEEKKPLLGINSDASASPPTTETP